MKYLHKLNINWKNDFYSILEKEIKVGDLLNNKLDNIPVSKELVTKIKSFLNSNNIKDTADVEYIEYDNGKYITAKTSKGDKQYSFNTLLKYLGYDTKSIAPKELQDFIEYFSQQKVNLKEVKGNKIKYAYLQDNFDTSIKPTDNKKSVFVSCMKYDKCQDYLEIYTTNPNQVSCLVLFNDDKVQGRALIWNLDDGSKYMDTIYTNDELITIFHNYAKQNDILIKLPNSETTVTLDNKIDYDYYPFMDTFAFYTPDTGVLSNKKGEYSLKSQEGEAFGKVDINTKFIDYCRSGNTNAVKTLLKDDRVNPSINNNYAIKIACEYNHVKIVELLLDDDRVNPADNDNVAIGIACLNGHIEVIKLLLTNKDIDTNIGLVNASLNVKNGLEVVKVLLKDKRTVLSYDDNTTFIYACKYNNIDLVEFLLKREDVNPTDRDNEGLYWACRKGYIKIVKMLLDDKRIDPSDSDNDIIKIAYEKGRTKIVELLAKDKRVIDKADNEVLKIIKEVE